MNKEKKYNGLEPVRILLFSASLSKDSLNKKLATMTASIIEKYGAEVDFATMSEFDTPSFNQDLEKDNFHPPGAEALKERLLANDAFIIASPECNGSISGVLKNTIDWVSRYRPQPFNGKHAFLMSASPSVAGGNPGLWSARIPLERLGANVYSSMFSLPVAHKAFSPDSDILDESLVQRLEETLGSFLNAVEATKHYPYLKKAWEEFMDVEKDPLARWVKQ